jgi:hypothetical protein
VLQRTYELREQLVRRHKIMTITPGLAVAATFAAVAVGAASPACADQTMSGHYIATESNVNGRSTTNDWYVTPCGDGCASVLSNGTSLGQARLANGHWTMDGTSNAVCADGPKVHDAVSDHFTWDPNTLAGTVNETFKVPACAWPAGYSYSLNLQLRQAP